MSASAGQPVRPSTVTAEASRTEPSPTLPAAARVEPEKTLQRYVSLDAYRGFIMVILAANGFGLSALSDHSTFGWLGKQFDHVQWEGLAFWDLIQPAFMFMVGMAMPFALARRRELGQSSREIFGHVLWRTFVLLLLSQILISVSGNAATFQLINVLSQIAFTYFLCFLIMQLKFRWQATAAAWILIGHWLLFALLPGSEGSFSKTDNIGAVIDRAILGKNYSGYYVTINFISSTVTTLFGVWAGQLLMKRRTHAFNVKVIAGASLACFLSGLALELLNPMIKRLWTASFTLFSAGWVFAMLLAFYWLVEIKGYRKLTFPLVVVGMNSIFIYSVSMVLHKWIDRSLAVFTGGFQSLGVLAPVAQATAVFLAMWYLCYWLYQRRIFFKI